MDSVLAVLREFDRLENNPFFPSPRFVERVLNEYGYLTLMAFVCPKMQSKYLGTAVAERFMPIEEPKDGLIFPRLPKLQELTTRLWQVGVPSRIILAVGDNDYEVYKGPPLGVVLDRQKVDERRKQYVQNLSSQLAKMFPQMIEVLSLGLMKVETYQGPLNIPEDMLVRETAFQQWTFEKYYQGQVPRKEVLREIATLKIRAYAEQGYLVETADAVLVSTEGTDLDSWTLRTEMFQVAGANFPVIFPYIRKEELGKKEGFNE